jgi:Acetyltransferase (GNAT) domain
MPKMRDATITLIDHADRAAWHAATAAHGLPGQSWGHAAGLAADGYVPELAVVQTPDATLTLPFHRRSFGGQTDIATLPGLSAATVHPTSDAPFLAWSDFARHQGWVSGYLQLSATTLAPRLPPPDQVMEHNALFLFDLATWSIEASVSANMRRSMRSGDRSGAVLVSDPARVAPAFSALHTLTRQRSGDGPAFGPKALETWFADPQSVAFGVEVEGKIVAAHLGRVAGGWADLHLAGANDAGRPLQAWLIWQALEHLRSRGISHVNIGGYGQYGDGLHMMKRRLGATERPLQSLRQIYRSDVYARLCAEAGTGAATNYFPAYRAPR